MLLAVSDAVWIAVINTSGILLLAYLQIRSGRKIDVNSHKIEEVHKATNSLVDRLVSTTKTEAHAAGVKEELDRAKPIS